MRIGVRGKEVVGDGEGLKNNVERWEIVNFLISESRQFDNSRAKKSSKLRLSREKVVKITSFARKSRQNVDFRVKKSSKCLLSRQKVVKMTTFVPKSRQNIDIRAKK